jgi:hypothetical protein
VIYQISKILAIIYDSPLEENVKKYIYCSIGIMLTITLFSQGIKMTVSYENGLAIGLSGEYLFAPGLNLPENDIGTIFTPGIILKYNIEQKDFYIGASINTITNIRDFPIRITLGSNILLTMYDQKPLIIFEPKIGGFSDDILIDFGLGYSIDFIYFENSIFFPYIGIMLFPNLILVSKLSST